MSGENQVNTPGPGGQPTGGEVPPWRLVATLGIFGALAGFLIVFSYVGTQPRIKAHKAEVLRQAIQEVLKAPARFDTLYVVDGALSEDLPAGQNADLVDQIYPGYRDDGSQVGFAIQSAEFGFQDLVRVIFGYDPAAKTIIGMLVLESKETPGLGDKIMKDPEFVAEFDGALVPIVGVKAGSGSGGRDEIDMITGATISSRAVIRIIENAIGRYGPLIESYNGGGS